MLHRTVAVVFLFTAIHTAYSCAPNSPNQPGAQPGAPNPPAPSCTSCTQGQIDTTGATAFTGDNTAAVGGCSVRTLTCAGTIDVNNGAVITAMGAPLVATCSAGGRWMAMVTGRDWDVTRAECQ